jgi:hypothetical protein
MHPAFAAPAIKIIAIEAINPIQRIVALPILVEKEHKDTLPKSFLKST